MYFLNSGCPFLGRTYISRSEARRLLVNLERFRRVELDFRNVESVGQGFADEVFRVFATNHPEIDLRPVHASAAVNAMIGHARAKA